MVSYLKTQGGRIAYHKVEGRGPGVVFLGGFMSDMEGTKAIFLEEWARQQGRAFMRFDYTGHGQSSGDFLNGCIGDWARDARRAIIELTDGPQVLVGSSMGGWIALLLARAMPGKIAGLVGVAAAPDFTEDSMWSGFDEKQRRMLEENGQIDVLSDYSDSPYIITQNLIEDGRDNLILQTPMLLPFPARFLQGSADADVDISVALRLLEHATGNDIHLTIVKDADHRFSTPECLEMICSAIIEVSTE